MAKKLRRDAVLKKLPAEQRQLVREWLEADGESSCRQRILSELGISSPKDKAQPISATTLYDAIAFWETEAITDELRSFRDAQSELFSQFKPGDAKLARECGEFAMMHRANKTLDKDIFTAATMAQDSRRRLDLEEASGRTKAQQKERQLQIAQDKLDLDREKFIALACEKIMAAARDPKTRAIVEDASLSNAEKIAALRKEYFADVDALQASGTVFLPDA